MPKMGNDKTIHDSQTSLPIPTYEEATSSRPSSSHSFLGPAEISHDAERQGLLGQRPQPRPQFHGYQPPTVDSARPSLDSLVSSENNSSARNSREELRREMSEMEFQDPDTGDNTAWKRISSLTSNIHLPARFRRWIPSFDQVRARFPRLPDRIPKPNWIIVIRAFALVFVLTLAYVVFFTSLLRFRRRGQQRFPEEDVRSHIQGHLNETKIREQLKHVTEWDHVAGTEGNFFLAKWIESEMKSAGLEGVELEKFEVYLNYPTKDGRSVSITSPPEKAWIAQIEEEKAYQDRQQSLVFHGHSKSGTVSGPLVYANYGSREDFDTLKDLGISVNGSVAIVRYYGTQTDRALKVKAAELAGAVGCIIYSDPAEDGFVKGKPYPDGRFRPSDGVQRGTVALTSWIAGDVLTPGYPSLPGGNGERLSPDSSPALNKIPSLPIAWRDAQHLLQSLKGQGHKLTNPDWIGGVPEVDEWWTGSGSPASSSSSSAVPIVKLQNEQDEIERQPIYNVLARIPGNEQSSKAIILGNHYDAWCYGGTDPGSGTAVFLELIRVFGDLMKYGWRPRRTIEFAAWDAEEYNLIGSTEHVEARLDRLRRDGYAYLNVDVAVVGDNFTAAASPVLRKALERVLKRVGDPKTGTKTVYDLWHAQGSKIGGLGAGSDYLAFQDFAGVSSLDMSFSGPPFPYHSCYDNFEWMDRYGDPGFQYHKAMGHIWALLALELADEAVLPFDLVGYAEKVREWVQDVEDDLVDKLEEAKQKGDKKVEGVASLDFSRLYNASSIFLGNANKFHEWENAWAGAYEGTGVPEGDAAAVKRMIRNDRMADFERDLLDLEGGGVSSLSDSLSIGGFVTVFSSCPYSHISVSMDQVADQNAHTGQLKRFRNIHIIEMFEEHFSSPI